MNLQKTIAVLAALESHGVDYAVFGAVALNLHGIGRATEDLDIFVRPERENIERLKESLREVFADPNVDELDVEELLGDYPAVRYYPPSSGDGEFYLDILTRLGEMYRFEDLDTQEIEVEGLKVRVITPAMLYRMKKDTVRLKDHADAAQVREKFQLPE